MASSGATPMSLATTFIGVPGMVPVSLWALPWRARMGLPAAIWRPAGFTFEPGCTGGGICPPELPAALGW